MKTGEATECLATKASILSELVASHLEPVLERYGVGFGTFDLVMAIHGSRSEVHQTTIAKRMGISAASLTESVKMAAKKGFVLQSESQSDLRAKKLSLTKKGDDFIQECMARLNEADRIMAEGVSESDLNRTLEVLQAAIYNLSRFNPDP